MEQITFDEWIISKSVSFRENGKDHNYEYVNNYVNSGDYVDCNGASIDFYFKCKDCGAVCSVNVYPSVSIFDDYGNGKYVGMKCREIIMLKALE